jgi:thiol-disulfide isomerase/thioredoxin
MLICALLTGAAGELYSQNKKPGIVIPHELKEISVGETIPDILISGFLDDSLKQVRLSDLYKDKLLILNFWSTTCGGCIKEMPELKELKKQFNGRLDFLLVNCEARARVKACDSRFGLFGDGIFTTLVGDTALNILFPNAMLPHFTWINSNGKVLGITDQISLTKENIARAIDGDINMRVKKDLTQFRPDMPFHLRDSSYNARSIITGRTDGINNYDQSFAPMMSRIFITNLSLFHLYANAAFGNSLFPIMKYRVFFETKDSLKYFAPWMAPESFRKSKYKDQNDWADENAYCYELDFKRPMPEAQMRQYMIQDLNRYFNLDGRFEKRMLKCWVLKARRKTKKLAARKDERPGAFGYDDGIKIRNRSIDVFAETLGRHMFFPLIINKTNIAFPVSAEVHGLQPGMTVKAMNRQLKPLGLYLKERRHYIDVFVISEK